MTGQGSGVSRMSRVICVAVLVLFLAWPISSVQSQSVAELSEDESAVYTALFADIYQAAKGRPIVLSDQTALGVPPGMIANIPVQGLQTQKFLSPVSPEAKQDYEDANHQSKKLPSPCHLAPECFTADIADLAPQVKDDRAWRGFFKKHRNTPGIVVVSRIGFNKSHTEGIVYTGNSCGTLCGQGEFVWLVKSSGGWAVKDRTTVWISTK
jgi:hypothetical protein